MITLLILFITAIFGFVISLIGLVIKVCFYLSPFGLIFMLLRPRPRMMYRRYYW